MDKLNRRSFLATSTALSIPMLGARATTRAATRGGGGPIAIASGNGLRAVTRAMEGLRAGVDPAEAAVEGVTIVEEDPDDMSVGYGGLPNENGVVQLDSSVMHGPTHKAGAVAAIEGIRTPARVALQVLRRTDHVLIVGDGAKQFALARGFKEQDLLTDRAREAWQRWKRNLNPNDDWLDDDQTIGVSGKDDRRSGAAEPIPFTWGTIHCAALDANGDLGAVTTTSGLSYKLPGRVGDSAIIGAGMYVENDTGAAGATGRGESVLQSCGSFQIVQHMARGDHPTEACLKTLKWIAAHTRRPSLRNERGEPNFGCTFYALRKDGVFGSATMRGGGVQFAVHDGTEARHEKSQALFK
jgi:N4-(beta-N-acetylglucosaminyl)-L-asparaginase